MARVSLPPLAGLVLALLASSPALGHAELKTSDPADGATLQVPPTVITVTFTEGLDAGKSSIVLEGPGGQAGEAAPAKDGATTITLDGLALAPGAYTVRWTAAAEDGHIERGTLGFTVLEATTAPVTAPPSASEPASVAAATPSPSPVSTAAPSVDGGTAAPAASTGDVLLPIVAALAVVGVIAALVLRRGRVG